MNILAILVICAAVFGICFGVDKLFTRAFRSKQQHKSGLAVRCSKKYGSFGLIIGILGIAAIFTGSTVMLVCGILLILGAAALVTYYLTFGIFYDEDAFVYTRFGKNSVTYRYSDICAQQLYNSAGNIIVELYMADGKAVQVQCSMDGAYTFLDKAFYYWLHQTGRRQEDCTFYDPQNSCWFPPVEG